MTEQQPIIKKLFWRDEYVKLICGFANAKGGTLVIGTNQKGIARGFPDVRRLSAHIPDIVKESLGIDVVVIAHGEYPDKYLEVTITACFNPISYKGQYFYRSGIITQELKGDALVKFLLRKLGKPWDGVPVPKVKMADLSDQAFELFRKRAGISNRLPKELLSENSNILLEKLRLKEDSYLNRAALLLFHPDPEVFFTGAFVKIGFFKTHTDLLYHDTIHGDLFEQVDKTMDLLLTKYRVDAYPFPEEAIKEAVINAIINKDYECGIPIQISVYADQLYIWNHSKMLNKHLSFPYNPGVANAFFQMGYLESWEGGMKKIIDNCTKAGLPSPSFIFDANGLMVEFKITV